jgi:O-antigen ligase
MGIFLVAVLVLQHRTTWVVLLAAVAYLLAASGANAAKLVAGGLVLAAAVIVLDFAGLEGSRTPFEAESLARSLQQATADDRTFQWRTERWSAALETNRARGTEAVVLGAGYGAPWVTFGPHAARTEPPHSQYVEFAVRFGIVGLGFWILLLARTARGLWRDRSVGAASGISNEFLLLVVLLLGIWSVAYSLVGVYPLVMGLAIGASAARTTEVAGRRRVAGPAEREGGVRSAQPAT